MIVEALKNAKLCPMTEGYLAIYLKLSELWRSLGRNRNRL